jgi:hypothetical protein
MQSSVEQPVRTSPHEREIENQEATLQSTLTCLWKEPVAHRPYRTAVSLHGHTNRSKEGLAFIPKFAARHAALELALTAQKRRAKKRSSIAVDFSKAYWTPPLPPLAAFQLEVGQIQNVLGLSAMVSLTDHDNIEAPMLLRVVPEARRIPVSVEWSAPANGTMVHLGVHNLPSAKAESIMSHLADYTKSPSPAGLRELLATLHQIPEVLIILNHPLWDLTGVGKMRHERAIRDFAAEFGAFVHAFELSGVRSWEENREVLQFAEAWDQLVIGGGDRHGAEPNAVLNLTDAESFSEFADEVRRRKRSHVLFMPQYARPFALRVFQSLLDIVREYPDGSLGPRRWDERVFHPDLSGEHRPLASLWRRPPTFIEAFFAAVRLLEIPAFQNAAHTLLATPEHQMHFNANSGQEANFPWSNSFESRTFPTLTRKSTAWRTPAANLRRSRENAGSPS